MLVSHSRTVNHKCHINLGVNSDLTVSHHVFSASHSSDTASSQKQNKYIRLYCAIDRLRSYITVIVQAVCTRVNPNLYTNYLPYKAAMSQRQYTLKFNRAHTSLGAPTGKVQEQRDT